MNNVRIKKTVYTITNITVSGAYKVYTLTKGNTIKTLIEGPYGFTMYSGRIGLPKPVSIIDIDFDVEVQVPEEKTRTKTPKAVVSGCRFGVKGVKSPDGNYHPYIAFRALESGKGEYICFVAKDYEKGLPAELNPINHTDLYTDYFEKDRVRFYNDHPQWDDLCAIADYTKD